MSVLGRRVRAAMSRAAGSGDTGGHGTDPRGSVLAAITRIRRDQAAVEARLGAATVDAAMLDRAVDDQRHVLHDASIQIRDAGGAAERAAERAFVEDGEAAAAPYRMAADGFGVQLQAMRATISQLDRLHGGAAANLDRTRALLRESAQSLDRALRAEVELLDRIERLDRERVIAATHRRHRDQPGEPG